MKKVNLIIIAFLVSTLAGFAKSVDVNYAMQVAQNFYFQTTGKTGTLTLAYQCLNTDGTSGVAIGDPVYYVFNVSGNNGFVMVAGEDLVKPVLGYSTKGQYVIQNAPAVITDWAEHYRKQIVYAKANRTTPTQDVADKWFNYYNNIPTINTRSTQGVNPLLNGIIWNQAPFYNDMCPADAASSNGHCVTGCVATAMAQIMRFWNYPAQGTGFHSYATQNYGTLNANFGSTTYNWANMPADIGGADNSDIETLMLHCGVAVDMNYGPNESTGWVIIADAIQGGDSSCAEYAYKTYFGYDPSTVRGYSRDVVNNDQQWTSMMQAELDAGRPIQYVGAGTAGGHTWVCDGYDGTGAFHMNWGWGGSDDGYFTIDALNPASLGIGGGAGGFNSQEEMVIGIKPLATSPTAGDIQLNSSITVTPNPIAFYTNFTVNADVINNGTSAYNGDFCAALFDASGAFTNYIGPILNTNGTPLQAASHYIGGITFSDSTTLAPTVPGSYTIGIYYRPAGTSNWLLAGSTNYNNLISVTINGPIDNIALSSGMTVSPTTFVQSQSASVTVNLTNSGSTTYMGQYEAVLLDLSGNFVEQIGTYTESTGLQAGFSYTSPYLTFSTNNITAAPGTYLLAIAENASGTSNWYYCGGQSYTNPVYVNVVAAPIPGDIYENDNTPATAYPLPVNFVGNTAHVTTPGSNIDHGTDLDYYVVNLPAGTNYSITARVQDSYNSTDGNTYTDDVVLSYSGNGGASFSNSYDPAIPYPLIIENGGSVMFLVADYFLGNVGTYLLDLTITSGVTAINKTDLNTIRVYPNPASSLVYIDAGDAQGNYSIKIFNILGELMGESNGNLNGEKLSTDVSHFAAGIYTVQLKTESGIVTSKFTVK